MAWFVGGSPHAKDHPKWWPLDGSMEAIQTVCASLQAEYSQLHRGDPQWSRHALITPSSGYRLPPIEQALSIAISSSAKSPPHVLKAGWMGYLVTRDVVKLIDELGDHDCQYVHVKVYKGRTKEHLEDRWILNITKRLSTIVAEKSPGVSENHTLGSIMVTNWGRGVTASSSAIGRSAIWCEHRFPSGRVGISNDLYQEIRRRKIRGWMFGYLSCNQYAAEI